MSDSIDIMLFGATGFTGKLVANQLATRCKEEGLSLGIAGRNSEKLKNIFPTNNQDISIHIADSNNLEDMRRIAKTAKVVCTTAGPYTRLGSNLVQACAESGTHYCDLTGEAQWIRKMIDQHEETAKKSGARIVHCCGFDSIPSDLGTHYLQQHAFKTNGSYLPSVRCRVISMKGGFSGGTIASMFAGIDDYKKDKNVGQILNDPNALTGPRFKSSNVSTFKNVRWEKDYGWTAPFVMSAINSKIVLRSNYLLGHPYSKDFKYDESLTVGKKPTSYFKAKGIDIGLKALAVSSALTPTRVILKKILPNSGEGPSEHNRETGFFNFEFTGPESEDNGFKAIVTGRRDPGYGATSRMLTESAMCLAQNDSSNIPNAGILTPATAFGDTLIENLKQHDIRFEIMPL